MSRNFTKTAFESLEYPTGSGDISELCSGASALSIFAWVYPDFISTTAANDNRIFTMRIGNPNTGFIVNVTSGSKLRVGGRSQDSDAFKSVTGSETINTSEWNSVGGVIEFDADRIRGYVNGVADFDSAISGSFGSTTYQDDGTPTIGACVADNTATTADLWDGLISHIAVWKVDIGDSAFEALYRGADPLTIRPESLVAYPDLSAGTGDATDLVNGLTLTENGVIGEGASVLVTRAGVESIAIVASAGNLATLTAALTLDGALTATNQTQSATLAGALTLGASLEATTSNNATLTAALTLDGSFSAANQTQTATLAAALALDASFVGVEGGGNAGTLTAALALDASLAATNQTQTATLGAALALGASFTATEAGAVFFTAALALNGALSATNQTQTAAFTAGLAVGASFAAGEAAVNSATLEAALAIGGALSATSQTQTATFTAAIAILGSFTDTLAVQNPQAGLISMLETDVAAILGIDGETIQIVSASGVTELQVHWVNLSSAGGTQEGPLFFASVDDLPADFSTGNKVIRNGQSYTVNSRHPDGHAVEEIYLGTHP